MPVFGTNTKLNSQPPEVTGAQGFGTPAAQQNAMVQSIGGAPSSPSADAKGQSPADKLLAYASNFTGGMPADGTPIPQAPANQPWVPRSGEGIANQLFPSSAQLTAPTGVNLPADGSPAPAPQPDNASLAKQLFVPAPADAGGSNGSLDTYPPPSEPPPPNVPSTGIGDNPARILPTSPVSTPTGDRTHAVAPLPTGSTPPDQATLTKTPVVPSPAQFTDQQLADHYKTGQPFTPEMQAILDQRNPRPPQGTENPGVAAEWYRGFAFLDPRFASITEADVVNQRTLATAGKFAAMGHPEWNDIGRWIVAGRPTGETDQYGYPVLPTTPQPTPPSPDSSTPSTTLPPPVPPPTVPPVAVPPSPAGTPPPPPAGAVPPPSPAGGQPGGPPAPWAPTWGDLGAPPDLPPIPIPDVSSDPWTQMLQKALSAQKDVGDNQIRRSVTAAQAATGGLNMGGFGGAIAAPIADYNAQLDKEGSTQLATAHDTAMNRALQASIAERQSQTQLQLGRMDVMSKKYSADQSLEGEKFRAQIDQAIAAAQNSSAEKISAAVNAKDLQTARIAADSAATIAAGNAAAAAAQAGASLAAQKYASDMAYQGTIQKIAQDRENSQLQYNLGITGIGNDTYKANLANQQYMLSLLKDMGPEQLAKYLFGQQTPPGPVFVQP